jgi:hypothetical protein
VGLLVQIGEWEGEQLERAMKNAAALLWLLADANPESLVDILHARNWCVLMSYRIKEARRQAQRVEDEEGDI